MASSVATQWFRSNFKMQMWDHDPDSASATIITPDAGTTKRYLDLQLYKRFAVLAKNTVLVGAGITKVEIVAAADTAFSSNLTVIKDSGTVAADDLNDWLMLECHVSEVAQLSSEAGLAFGSGLRYIAARLTLANSADEATVTYIAEPKSPLLDLTPATTIS